MNIDPSKFIDPLQIYVPTAWGGPKVHPWNREGAEEIYSNDAWFWDISYRERLDGPGLLLLEHWRLRWGKIEILRIIQ